MSNLIPVEVKNNIGTIEDNLDVVEASIRQKLAEYTQVVITKDSIQDGKELLADIRKEKKSLDDERKAIKKAWMKPYEVFEARAKKIIDLYDEPVKLINSQLEAYEEDRKVAKRNDIKKIYEFVVKENAELADWLPLDKIYDTKWENATCKDKTIREAMEMVFSQIKVSISTIQSMQSAWEEDALNILKDTGSLQLAIEKISSLTKQAERIEEAKKAQEEAKRTEEARKAELEATRTEDKIKADVNKELSAAEKAIAEVSQDKAVAEVLQEFIEPEIDNLLPFAAEKIVVLKVHVGENNLDLVKDFFESINIEYEVME